MKLIDTSKSTRPGVSAPSTPAPLSVPDPLWLVFPAWSHYMRYYYRPDHVERLCRDVARARRDKMQRDVDIVAKTLMWTQPRVPQPYNPPRAQPVGKTFVGRDRLIK